MHFFNLCFDVHRADASEGDLFVDGGHVPGKVALEGLGENRASRGTYDSGGVVGPLVKNPWSHFSVSEARRRECLITESLREKNSIVTNLMFSLLLRFLSSMFFLHSSISLLAEIRSSAIHSYPIWWETWDSQKVKGKYAYGYSCENEKEEVLKNWIVNSW